MTRPSDERIRAALILLAGKLPVRKPRVPDMTGLRFGELVVLSRAPSRINGTSHQAMWHCYCGSCGALVIRAGIFLRLGRSKRCGACANRLRWATRRQRG